MASLGEQLRPLGTLVTAGGGLLAVFWLLMTFLPADAVGRFEGGTFVREANRNAGRWLLERAAPRPACGTDQVARAADVEGLYSWTDESGVHYVEDPSLVPEKHRAGSKVEALPVLTTYSGAYSRLRPSANRAKPAARIAPPVRPTVAIVYTAEWCTACKDTKALLRSLGVEVEERDVEKTPQAEAELVKLAGPDSGIPVTVIGKKVIGGFDESALRAAVSSAK